MSTQLLSHEGDNGETYAECPFCAATNESCKHLIACFGISEPAVTAGVLTDHEEELLTLMTGYQVKHSESDEDWAEDEEEADGQPDIEDFLGTLRAFLENHAEVSWAEFSVDEGGGLWDYANYWARYPGVVVDELYRHLESARTDY